jgi:AraC family transcriptional regulator
MAHAAAARISVIRHDQLVPLIPTTSARKPISAQPWKGILLERHQTGGIEIPEHEHKDFCLHLQLSGSVGLEWWCEGHHGLEETRPGSLVLLDAGTRDRLRWDGSSERLILSITPEFMANIAADIGSAATVEFENRWALRDPALQNLILEMSREASADWPLGGLYADLLGTSLGTYLLRRHAAAPSQLLQLKGGLTFAQLRRVLEFITVHIHTDIRLEQMANELSMTPFHFARLFRKSLGTSPYQYVLDQRLRAAQSILKSSKHSVQAIAALTGWNSPANFIRAFRQRYGVTPQTWRNR